VKANAGFSLAGWCGDEACETKVKADSHATIRCLPLEQPEDPGTCVVCGKKAEHQVVFARAY
jgi:prolyl-tRNA synthetase